jgi:hypothetical protein
MLSQSRQKGFTFVEIMLVGAMLMVLGLSIYSTLSNGLKLWQRISQEQPTEEIILFFDKFALDLRNSFNYTGIYFIGSSDEVSFPLISEFTWDGVKKEGIGRVSYIFDRVNNAIKTRRANYSQVYEKKFDPEQELVRGVESLSFQYYYYDPGEEKFAWVNSWQKDSGWGNLGLVAEKKLPLAVRVEIGLREGSFSRKFRRTVFIPAAYYSSFVEQ